MEKWLTCSPDSRLHKCECSGQIQNVRATETLKVPIAPMGDSRFARCLQGGGVFVERGTVTFSSCTISGNTASNVRAHAHKFPSPLPRLTFYSLFAQGGGVAVNAGTVAISSSNISGNTASNVRAKFPYPNGMSCFCVLLCDLASPILRPGAQCLCLWRHCLLLADDPHRRLWHSLNLPSTPAFAAITASFAALTAATLTATSASALPLATRALTSSCSSSTSVSTGAPPVAPSLATAAQPAAALALTAAALALATAALIAVAIA